MESYIRSKYESRRWALDAPPPSNPSVLDGGRTSTSNDDIAPASSDQTGPGRATHTPSNSLSIPRAASPSLTFNAPSFTRHQPQPRQLLSAAVVGRVTSLPSTTPHTPTQNQTPQPTSTPNDLFSLDFHAPSTPKPASAPPPPVKDVKQDILSLFSSPARPSTATSQTPNAFGQLASAQWDALGSGTQQQQQPSSMVGASGVGMWGVSSGWAAPASNNTTNIWGAPATSTTTLNTFNTNDIWASGSNNSVANSLFTSSQAPAAPKKDNAFGDLWGDFK